MHLNNQFRFRGETYRIDAEKQQLETDKLKNSLLICFMECFKPLKYELLICS